MSFFYELLCNISWHVVKYKFEQIFSIQSLLTQHFLDLTKLLSVNDGNVIQIHKQLADCALTRALTTP